MTWTNTVYGRLDVTTVALDLTEVLTAMPEVAEPTPNGDYVKACADHDAALAAAAHSAYPDQRWHLQEPSKDTIVVDRRGVFWAFIDTDPHNQFSDPEWTELLYTVDQNSSTCPSIGNSWDDVMAYGPIRTYDPNLDGPVVWRIKYRPDGVGTRSGPTYLLDTMPTRQAG